MPGTVLKALHVSTHVSKIPLILLTVFITMQKFDFYVAEFINLSFTASGICIMLRNTSSALKKKIFLTFTCFPLVCIWFQFLRLNLQFF